MESWNREVNPFRTELTKFPPEWYKSLVHQDVEKYANAELLGGTGGI
jgi:hypothetical protein